MFLRMLMPTVLARHTRIVALLMHVLYCHFMQYNIFTWLLPMTHNMQLTPCRQAQYHRHAWTKYMQNCVHTPSSYIVDIKTNKIKYKLW